MKIQIHLLLKNAAPAVGTKAIAFYAADEAQFWLLFSPKKKKKEKKVGKQTNILWIYSCLFAQATAQSLASY